MFVLCLLLLSSACAIWTIELKDHTDPTHFAQEHGLVYLGKIGFLNGEWHKFDFPAGSNKKRALIAMRDAPAVIQVHEQVEREQYKRISDPMFEAQWHLHKHSFSIDADRAPSNVTGKGITIAIVDDGLEKNHPDLKANFHAEASWNFNDHNADPTPTLRIDGHGTAAAGVAAAVKENGHCGRGAAPGAKLVGLRTIAKPVTDLVEAEALTHNAIGVVDIYSCSWGPVDDGISMVEPGPVVQAALQQYAGHR